MSIKVMSHIWENSKQEGGALLILLALADFASDEGRAFPSVPTLAKKARLTVRHTQRVLQELEKVGEIAIDPQAGPHGCNLYRVILSPRQNVTPDICDGRGVTSTTGGVTPMSPEPSLEPSGEPSGNKYTARAREAVAVYEEVYNEQLHIPAQEQIEAEDINDLAEWRNVVRDCYASRNPAYNVGKALHFYRQRLAQKARGKPARAAPDDGWRRTKLTPEMIMASENCSRAEAEEILTRLE